MKTGKDCFVATRRLRAALMTSSALALAWTLPATPSQAQDATWLASPSSNSYTTGANWDTGTRPTGTAYFGASNITDLSFFGGVTVGGWTFNAGASNYTFDLSSSQLTFTGAGIVINSGGATIDTDNFSLYFRNTSTAGGATININGIVQFFDSSTAGTAAISNNGFLQFSNSSTAGNAAISNNSGLEFYNTSTAGSATITNNNGGTTTFYSNSTAGNAAITNDYLLYFQGYSTAGSATITNNGGITFDNFSTAGDASIVNNGGLTFQDNSTAGDAAIINNANASVDFSPTTGLNGDNKISVGSIAGAGFYQLGANELTVGANNQSTEVSGVIAGTGGSLVKIGTGTLTLSGANTYTGGTTVNGGTLQLGTAASVGTILGTVIVGASGTFDVVNANTSGITSISNDGTTIFHNASSAGTASITNNDGTLYFRDASTAASATISNSTNRTTAFYDTSTAGHATINNSGLTYFYGTSSAGNANIVGSSSGQVIFQDSSTAANAIITGGTFTGFYNTSSAGSATITTSGQLSFRDTSTAGSATITLNTFAYAYFLNTSTAGTATINNDGSLSFGGTSTADNAVITSTNSIDFRQTSTAGYAAITNNGSLTFGASSTAASATITNNLAASFGGASTAGSATISNSYNLSFTGTSTAGNAVITNNAGGPFNNSSGMTSFRDNATAGNAQLINNGANTFFDFSGSSGPNGDNKLSAGSIAGDGTFYLGANALTVGGNNLSTTVSGVIADGGYSGAAGGSLVKTGTGTLTLTGTNTYTGGTTFAGGTVSVASEDNLGDLAGGLTFKGGTLQITGTAFNTTARTINLGAGGGTFDIADAANNFVLSQNLGGTTLTKTGAGKLTLTGAENFSGATVSAGTLAFSASATAGNAVIANSGNVVFDGNSTPGNAQLVNAASAAVFDLSMTSGPNSDNRLTAGSISGVGTFHLGANELTVGSNNLSTNVAGVIADGGSGGGTGASLVKIGTGTLTLSGINTYTGATVIDGGTLAVNGSVLASSGVTVNSGGTLGGTGTVGNTTIASGGTLAPGNSVGTLSVSGNVAFSVGSFYRVEVSATAADRTNVTGTATLTGATVQAVAIPGSFRSQTYTILNATGGLGGTQFAGLSASGSFSPTRNPHLTYDTNNVYLVLDPGTIVLPAGTGANPTNVADAINRAVAGGATPPAGFDALLNMGNPQLNHALGQVSGQPGAASTQAAFDATQQFVNMLDPLNGGSDGERGGTAGGGTLGYASTETNDARVREAYAAVTPRQASGDVLDSRWGVWASGYGGASNLNGNAPAGSSTTTSRIYGTAVGADYRLSPDTLLGFALGGAGFNFSVADSLGSGRADVFQAGLYARHNFGPAYISAALAYGWQVVTTDRTVTVSGTDKLTANFKASTFAGRLETGWRFVPIPASTFGVTPYAAVQATAFHLPGYGETALVGSNQFALSYTSQDTTNVRTEFGARTDQRFLVNDGVLTLRSRLAWAHDTNTNRFVNAAFQTLPGAAFTVSGARPAADSALVGGRAEMTWRNGLSLAGTVEGEFSQSTQTYTGKGTVRYAW
ncbi:autotransporter domain-containing protein [Bradyrhizobium cajani]|uniref:Autotransporter domain-containing protein n=1 Tax=Bradyrhizobium cajani TaxID=1928661 RepID=A0A844TNV5_9BRAD|nr:autotransporter domain-containing protein [Bradyrhizobium cajani]MCP3368374.1 autotransporter domain-containing protein [Bradyrhizobium cajani]MVT76962.1 autotransporter domain-containing protein [Bradyrhizobium cajani]